jgi:hypothetical protein
MPSIRQREYRVFNAPATTSPIKEIVLTALILLCDYRTDVFLYAVNNSSRLVESEVLMRLAK